jgi:hypothetical protein
MQGGDDGHDAGAGAGKPSRSGALGSGVGAVAQAVRKSLDIARHSAEMRRSLEGKEMTKEANTARRISMEVSRLSNEIARYVCFDRARNWAWLLQAHEITRIYCRTIAFVPFS